PARMPAHLLDCVKRASAKIVAIHADEPLLGRAENHRIVTAPAMRIAVIETLLSCKCAMLFEQLNDERIDLPNRFADQFGRKFSAGAFGVKNTAGGIDRAIHGNPITLADNEVFLSVTRSSVYCAGTLFERDVIAEKA